MSTKKLQILGSLSNRDADTLDGKHADEFAAASDVAALQDKVGDTKVSEQITDAIASKSDVGHNHDGAYDVKGAAAAVKNDLLNGAGTAYDTLKELGDLIDENQDAIAALETVASSKANTSDLTSHTNNKSNPHGVTAAQIGAATKSELNAVSALVGDTKVSTQISNAIANKSDTSHTHDDRYYTETEVNNLLSGKAASSHGNHVPATQTANNAKFLRNDNTWQTVTPANIGALGVNGTAVNAEKLTNNWVTGSVLDFALSCPVGLTNFVTSGETTDLPTWSNNYDYGTGLVMKRSDAFVYVELHPYNVKNNPIARNSYNNDSWYGWTYDYSEANKPTASDVGAAPAGYGLGDACQGISDWNNATENGFYQCSVNAPTAASWYGYVVKHTDNYVVQSVYTLSHSINPLHAVRSKYAGEWKEWEWVNPPMVANVSYRTTERYNGSPVYRKYDSSSGKILWSTDNSTWNDQATLVGALSANGTAVNADKLAVNWVDGSLLDFATSCSVGITYFVTSSDTTDLPLPTDKYMYGTGVVMKRTDNFIYIELHPYNAEQYAVARKTYNSGWHPWSYGDVAALPLSGGTMTGQIALSENGYKTNSTSGYSVNKYGDFKHQSATSTDCWEFKNNAETISLKYYPEKGELIVPKKLSFDSSAVQVLSSGIYGSSLPAAGTAGRIFFKKVSS